MNEAEVIKNVISVVVSIAIDPGMGWDVLNCTSCKQEKKGQTGSRLTNFVLIVVGIILMERPDRVSIHNIFVSGSEKGNFQHNVQKMIAGLLRQPVKSIKTTYQRN